MHQKYRRKRAFARCPECGASIHKSDQIGDDNGNTGYCAKCGVLNVKRAIFILVRALSPPVPPAH